MKKLVRFMIAVLFAPLVWPFFAFVVFPDWLFFDEPKGAPPKDIIRGWYSWLTFR